MHTAMLHRLTPSITQNMKLGEVQETIIDKVPCASCPEGQEAEAAEMRA